ncbi:HSF-type DNA-binding-domain-containing protein [Blakeslea trispora]|nr:HSF-type DNA-binding-domain-containing protein [Blakeslea trispora]
MVKNTSRSSSSSSGESRSDQRFKRLKLSNTNSSSNSTGSSSGSDAEKPNTSSDTNVPRSTTVALPNTIKTQAAFVNKLYKMLQDPESSNLISWSSVGDLFSVSNPTTFSKTVLPQYFKHNNWQSFVRQLNMYGFHKVNDLIHSNLTNENQTWEFKHPNFRRGGVDDLQNIKRKNAKANQAHWQQNYQRSLQHESQHPIRSFGTNNDNIHSIENANQNRDTNDAVIKHILRIEEHLLGVTRSCEQLFSEVAHLRMVVSKQQNAMQDLVDVVSSSRSNACACGNFNNNNNNNKQELLCAENLRIQVSKLKESQNMNKISNDLYKQGESNTRWSPSVSGSSPYISKTEPRSPRTASHSSVSSGTTVTFTSQNNTKHTYKKLPSLESIQQSYDCLHNTNDGTITLPNSEENKTRSSMMSFGKQSHMLNPVEGECLISIKRNRISGKHTYSQILLSKTIRCQRRYHWLLNTHFAL